MGDIAFLLIIFFMICSNFAKEAGIPVRPPHSPSIERVKQASTIVTIDAEGKVYFQGRRVADARSIEAEVGETLKNAASREGRMVLFRCDRAVGREVFEPVMDAITRAGGVIVAVGEKK